MHYRRAPTGYQINAAMSVAEAVRASVIADDPEAADDSRLLADLIDGQTDALDIVRALIRFGIEAQSLADAADERLKALRERKSRFERRVEAARGTAFAMLQALDFREKLEEPDFTASISRGRPKLVTTGEPPDPFARVVREWDKVAAKAAIEAGQKVENASLSNGAPTLVVRVK